MRSMKITALFVLALFIASFFSVEASKIRKSKLKSTDELIEFFNRVAGEDQAISLDEWITEMKIRVPHENYDDYVDSFTAYDKNKDGKLTKDDLGIN